VGTEGLTLAEVVILEDADAVATLVPNSAVALLRRKPDAVLGLTTGSSPLPTYRSLVTRHRNGEVSFARARGFLLVDHVGLPPDHPGSYRAFIHRELVRHVDFAPGAVTGPDVHAADLAAAGPAYGDALRAAGGVDLQLLGIGTDGHIAPYDPHPIESPAHGPQRASPAPSPSAKSTEEQDPGETMSRTRCLMTA
jgi:glucosamine-6-phosphate deaminase